MRLLKTTALGAAWLAGQFVGFYPEQDAFARLWKVDARFEPTMEDAIRDRRYAAWKRAVAATMGAVLSIL
jgi:glycerol kinase